jgi:hypothetical protein
MILAHARGRSACEMIPTDTADELRHNTSLRKAKFGGTKKPSGEMVWQPEMLKQQGCHKTPQTLIKVKHSKRVVRQFDNFRR